MLPGIKSHISVFTLPKLDADSSEIKDHTHDKCTPSSGSKEIFFITQEYENPYDYSNMEGFSS